MRPRGLLFICRAILYSLEQNVNSVLKLTLPFNFSFVLVKTISEIGFFLYPGNVIGPGNVPLQVTQSTVSDIPDSWLQVRGLDC